MNKTGSSTHTKKNPGFTGIKMQEEKNEVGFISEGESVEGRRRWWEVRGGEERLAGGTCFNLGERSRIKLAGSSARSGQDFLWSLLISSPVLLLLGAGRPGCVQGSRGRQGNFKASFFSPPFISTPHPVAPAVPEAHTHTHLLLPS